jgi:hypothetical protein
MITEKRSSRRFFGRIPIISTDEQGLNFGFITNLSREGAYIESEKVLPAGTPFEFVLSNGKAKAGVASHVVRARDAFFHGGKSGFGVHFDQLQGISKALRDDLLLFLMNRAHQSIWERT